MADNVEIHNKTGITVKTGGSKEFHYTNEDLERIHSDDSTTREFKEALALHYYVKDPEDILTTNDLKKYKKFFKIKYKVFNKKKESIKKLHVDINIRYKGKKIIDTCLFYLLIVQKVLKKNYLFRNTAL